MGGGATKYRRQDLITSQDRSRWLTLLSPQSPSLTHLMIFSTLITLFASLVVAQELVEEKEGIRPCGGGCFANSCLNPQVHFQNYQDINANVAEYYNFQTSFPLLNNESYGWTVTNEGYIDGEFQMLAGIPIFMMRNSPLLLENQDITYISAQLDYMNFAEDPLTITSPLGAGGDPFYASGLFSAVDNTQTGLEYAFALTNTTVYAIYGRTNVTQTPLNDYTTFRYLVPIQPIHSNSIYTFVFNKEDQSVAWMIDGTVRMIIPISGKLIDEKFQIGEFTGTTLFAAFPNSLSIAVGGDRLSNGSPHTACQNAIFQYCDRTQSIFNATSVECTYEPVQDPSEYFINQLMDWTMFSITQATLMKPACGCQC